MIANLTEELNSLRSSSVASIAQPDLIGFITEIEPKRSPMDPRDEPSDMELGHTG